MKRRNFITGTIAAAAIAANPFRRTEEIPPAIDPRRRKETPPTTPLFESPIVNALPFYIDEQFLRGITTTLREYHTRMTGIDRLTSATITTESKNGIALVGDRGNHSRTLTRLHLHFYWGDEFVPGAFIGRGIFVTLDSRTHGEISIHDDKIIHYDLPEHDKAAFIIDKCKLTIEQIAHIKEVIRQTS